MKADFPPGEAYLTLVWKYLYIYRREADFDAKTDSDRKGLMGW
jgi:hypothetical protein